MVIDFGLLNKAITKVETLLSQYNIEERDLIMRHVTARIVSERQKMNESMVMQRAIDKLPFGKLMSRAMKSQGGEQDDT